MKRRLTREDIERGIARNPRWHYQFDLQGIATQIHCAEWINRHRERKNYFFDPLARAGLLEGKRVLDLGCNAGFWSLQAIRAGCAHVVGIDVREVQEGDVEATVHWVDDRVRELDEGRGRRSVVHRGKQQLGGPALSTVDAAGEPELRACLREVGPGDVEVVA